MPILSLFQILCVCEKLRWPLNHKHLYDPCAYKHIVHELNKMCAFGRKLQLMAGNKSCGKVNLQNN